MYVVLSKISLHPASRISLSLHPLLTTTYHTLVYMYISPQSTWLQLPAVVQV